MKGPSTSRLPVRQIVALLAVAASTVAVGTLGFAWIEKQPLFDSFYMTLITLTTIGYEEVFELSDNGRYFNVVLIVAGYTIVFASIGLLVNSLIQLELQNYFERRRTRRMIERMSGHYIVCGLGRVGRGVIQWLQRSGSSIVAIDRSPEMEAWADDHGVPILVEDATLDETLDRAGARRAKGLVAATSSDAVNVYITLSARVLNPDLRIGARASEDEAAKKLTQAGANSVFSPYKFTGYRIAQSLLRPHFSSFLDMASTVENSDFGVGIEEYPVSERSICAGRTLESSDLRKRLDVIVLAVARNGGAIEFNPPEDSSIESGDTLILMGRRQALGRIREQLEA